jgi:hypothetical protein
MPKLHHITVTAKEKRVHVVTGKKRMRYQKIEGLPNGGMPEGQEELYENVHGIHLEPEQIVELDVSEAQMVEFQAAVDRGEIEVLVHQQPAAPNIVQLAPTAEKKDKAK